MIWYVQGKWMVHDGTGRISIDDERLYFADEVTLADAVEVFQQETEKTIAEMGAVILRSYITAHTVLDTKISTRQDIGLDS